ncbi:MAG: hypothetical protein VB040_12215 [Propionibacterium sp.]|nr:hypothetical protein [Propionibacterium sp.]
MNAQLEIVDAGIAAVTDLGRRGQAFLGVQTNGAADQYSARTANILVGNDERAPLIEIFNVMPFAFRSSCSLLIAVTGAAESVLVDGEPAETGQPLFVWPGAVVKLPPASTGLRTYIGIRGRIEGDEFLGSVATDSLIGRGRRLSTGDVVHVDNGAVRVPSNVPFFRFGAPQQQYSHEWVLDVVPGVDADEFPTFVDELPASTFTVGNQSDHVGVRLEGPHFERSVTTEIVSRGVPLGAIEAPPTGSLIILMRGRPLTAGYPIPAVVARSCHHLLGQLRPGDSVRLKSVSVAESIAQTRRDEARLSRLRRRCATAFTACWPFESVSRP